MKDKHKPVSIHCLFQLVVKYKLRIPETKVLRCQYLHCELSKMCFFRTSTLPFVSFDVVPLDVLQVVSHVVLQRGHHAAVFVHQLGGAGLRCEPVHHRRQLLLLHLLVSQQHACAE